MNISLRMMMFFVIAVLLCLIGLMPKVQGTTYFESHVHFGTGTGVYVSFTESATANSIARINDYWVFSELRFNGVSTNITWTNSGSDVIIEAFDPEGWIKYGVEGKGTQTFSVKRNPTIVYIDEVQASSGWNFSKDNYMVTVSSASSTVALDFTPVSVSTSYIASFINSSYFAPLILIIVSIAISIVYIYVRRFRILIGNLGNYFKKNKSSRLVLIIVVSLLGSFFLTSIVKYSQSLHVESCTSPGIFTMANETKLSETLQIKTNGPGYFESVGIVYAYFFSPYASTFNNFSVWMCIEDSSWIKVPVLPFQTNNRSLMGNIGLVNLDKYQIDVNTQYFFPPQTINSGTSVSIADLEESFTGYIQIVKKPTPRDTFNEIMLFSVPFVIILAILFYIVPFERQKMKG